MCEHGYWLAKANLHCRRRLPANNEVLVKSDRRPYGVSVLHFDPLRGITTPFMTLREVEEYATKDRQRRDICDVAVKTYRAWVETG